MTTVRHTPAQENARRTVGLRGLILVNGALLLLLAFVTFGSPVTAQFRASGVYHGVSATASGVESGVIVVVDETNQGMIGLGFDPNSGKLVPAGKRDLAADVAALRGQ